ncbi:MAG TPA: hypothetical protein VER11_10665 [Polyangiaceae bacterium]|nr:hypothetical protein [Polyangiaceae bacterium]
MRNYAGALFAIALGGGAYLGAGCDNGSGDAETSGAGAAPIAVAGAGSSAGGAAVAGAATAPTAGAGTSAGSGGALNANTASSDTLPANALEVVLAPSTTGFVNDATGVVGAWYAYGDGNDGANPGVCQTVGMHVTTECSAIEAPLPGMPFAPTGTSLAQMCTTGTVAKVINFGDPPAPDYSNLFGAGIGLDLNNPGLDGGTGVKMPFNTAEKKIIGISFDLDAVPASGLRVEFPFGSASTAAGVWKPNKTSYASPVGVGHNVLLFASVMQPGYVKAADLVPFDPTTLTSIQFHVPTNTTAAAPYHFCIDKLALIVQM